MLDSAGRLIGVTTAIVSTSGASAGLGFAVPANDVYVSVAMVLKESIGTESPSMGIAILDAETARENGIPEQLLTGGLVILYVYPETPAAAAGLQGCMRRGNSIMLGDQITAIEGTSVSSFEELKTLMSEFKTGDAIRLDVVRGTRKFAVSLTLEARARRVLL